MKTLILCGGKGTRAHPHTLEVPKPLMEVGGQPILAQVMQIYADQGHTDFVLAAGFKAEMVDAFAARLPPAWAVEVVDTGVDTNTAARVARCRHLLGPEFFLTYCDGLSDVDLGALVAFHRSHPGSATVTTVPLPSQYGTLELTPGGRVTGFAEKPRLRDHWINAGFFVIGEAAFAHWRGEDLERDVLPALGAAGELYAFRHEGFWRSMDTYKDAVELAELCREGGSPWLGAGRPGGAREPGRPAAQRARGAPTMTERSTP